MRYTEITEATVPPTQYGYWISQYAEIYPVGNHGHEAFVKSVEGINSAEAILDGWVRVVVGKSVFQAEACFGVIKPRIKSKIVALARADEYSTFIVDNYSSEGEYTVSQFASLHDFIHGIEAMSRQMA